MRNDFWLLAVLLFCAFDVAAQDTTRMEVFAGLGGLDGSFRDRDLQAAVGAQAGFTVNLTRRVGIVADVGVYADLGTSDLTGQAFLLGPRLHARARRGTGFVHALAGPGRGTAGNQSVTVPAFAFGGGGDFNFTQRWSARGLVDWLPVRYRGEWVPRSVRIGLGVAIRFGERL